MAVSQKNHFKLGCYLNFRLRPRVNLILRFRKISKLVSQNFELIKKI